MRVPRHDEVVAERRELGRRIGGVHDGQAEPSRPAARRGAQVHAVDVRVVQADHLDRRPVQRDVVALVLEVDPTVGRERPLQVLGPAPSHAAPADSPACEVVEVVQGARTVVVVRAEDEERTEPSPHRLEGPNRVLHALRFAEEVSGDHRDVGSRKVSQERRLARVAGHEMEIREVQQRQQPLIVPG